ncbi:MAG: hypothetical protein GTN82_13135 [Candidatus Aminicenantes bacterium]|nr:hypothetical protein [Candidatus Aminicenantes bacterium]NIO81850.1 hypothetical protein [Candidatus Aminicenantes bacterium]NIQ67723.1 hypothetical protein [Candidatus Aminicenantes bacterium]NIR06360.1 hypothetical protein [Candidatus Aminicenantes bacterium]
MIKPVLAQETIEIPQPPQVQITELGRLISGAIGMALIAAALAAFFYLILGGFQWITSGGDKAGTEAAREKITAAFIGLAIVVTAWAIMRLIEVFFGITIISGPIQIPKPY